MAHGPAHCDQSLGRTSPCPGNERGWVWVWHLQCLPARIATFPELGLLIAKSGLRGPECSFVPTAASTRRLVWGLFLVAHGKPAFLNSDKIRESLADSWILMGQGRGAIRFRA